ncbi:hypothetical protein CJ030_MR0G019576 [Morella rubra]|uniref:Uncharacterized protein n=1 Tax=Morella rubra TaxID=262757 RepID=A0A6A1UH79_9ROSI|nr:hypothetical protein CJ030_MR0G019576 [Morella rubra]
MAHSFRERPQLRRNGRHKLLQTRHLQMYVTQILPHSGNLLLQCAIEQNIVPLKSGETSTEINAQPMSRINSRFYSFLKLRHPRVYLGEDQMHDMLEWKHLILATKDTTTTTSRPCGVQKISSRLGFIEMSTIGKAPTGLCIPMYTASRSAEN